MAELVDAPVLEAGIERCASSSLALGTKFKGGYHAQCIFSQ